MRINEGTFAFVWDLGREWAEWTGLPFVFAMWVARSDISLAGLPELFAAARDDGASRLEEIARRAAPEVVISEEACLTYLRDHLNFHLGPRQRQGLESFGRMAAEYGLVPTGASLVFAD